MERTDMMDECLLGTDIPASLGFRGLHTISRWVVWARAKNVMGLL